MRFEKRDPPRAFTVGFGGPIEIRDCGSVYLETDEQLTFTTNRGGEYDVVRKGWGFYATPSLNGRLVDFGLRGVIVRNRADRCFVLLVEEGEERSFEKYLEDEGLTVVTWLDNQADLDRLGVAPRLQRAPLRCDCAARHFAPVFAYDAPPTGETRFGDGPYRREVLGCGVCGHFVSIHEVDQSLYEGRYVDSTYGADALRTNFERIISLPPERSDNAGRVRRIIELLGTSGRVLDVGSGLCVFLHGMKHAGWQGTALDPDPRAVAHARDVVGVKGVCADFREAESLGRFDLVTFNKVLEHVEDPVGFLAKSAEMVSDDGIVYVEVPDGEAAVVQGPDREEFFVEHLHIFSGASLALLAERSGFSLHKLERLHEPSGKYTLAAFLRPRP